MTALTPKARALVKAGREAFRPAAEDRARLGAALQARLGADALPPDASAVPPSAAASPALAGGWIVPGITAIVLLAGAGLVTTHFGGSDAKAPSVASAASAPLAIPLPPLGGDPVSFVPVEEAPGPAPVATSVSRAPASRAKDRLAEEVALLSRAASDLHAGRAGDALRALDEHQRRFPNGVLREERRAAKARALCASKRITEGRAELAHLPPGSPAAVHAKRVCDANARVTP